MQTSLNPAVTSWASQGKAVLRTTSPEPLKPLLSRREDNLIKTRHGSGDAGAEFNGKALLYQEGLGRRETQGSQSLASLLIFHTKKLVPETKGLVRNSWAEGDLAGCSPMSLSHGSVSWDSEISFPLAGASG